MIAPTSVVDMRRVPRDRLTLIKYDRRADRAHDFIRA